MKLTPKESSIVDALCERGCCQQELATRFGISVETIKRHMTNIYNKTGYSSAPELIANTLHKHYESILANCPASTSRESA